MTKEELIDFLRSKLEIHVDYSPSRAYWQPSEIKVQLLLNTEVISESITTIHED